MRIRFQTKDNLNVVKNFPNLTEPPAALVRPIIPDPRLWTLEPDAELDTKPIGVRRYEYRGEVRNGIPTLHEC